MEKNDDGPAAPGSEQRCKIKIMKNGPYRVTGSLPLVRETIISNSKGYGMRWEKGEEFPGKKQYALCRCGRSKTSPYCDGSHTAAGFDGTETAARQNFEIMAQTIEGPDLVLSDAESLCASARLCNRTGGTWNLTRRSDNPRFKKIAIEEAGDCPSGRLVTRDKKTGEAIEPALEPSISLVEDPFTNSSGPFWVKGCVPIESSDGTCYEIRNRVTLCRCGRSGNKPFCDGSHTSE
jgi:CDGSH-type Zn-finger protein